MSQRDRMDEIFRAVAGQMQTDFQATRRLVRHKGLRGKAAENNLVAAFVRRYLPATLTIRQNAEVVSSAGDVSTECDLLICDPSTPPLWSANDVEIVPVECLHGLIEIKSVLKPADLREAWVKTAVIKRYPKTAWVPSNRILKPVIERYGRRWEYFPTVGFVFAFTSRSSLKRLREVMWELAHETEPEHRLDGVWILDKGCILWRSGTTGDWLTAQPGDDVWIQSMDNPPGGSPLPLMTMQLQGIFQSAFMPLFRIGDYMGDLPVGLRDVIGPEHPATMPPWLNVDDPGHAKDRASASEKGHDSTAS
jgi:Domain of unknown function (DUF6602)